MARPVGQNVAEMFVVIGWDNTIETEDDSSGEEVNENPPSLFSLSLDAAVLDQYPTHEYLDRVPSGLQYLCFPLGLSIKDVPLPPQFHSFIHTSQDGSRLIGSVLTFYEEITAAQRNALEAFGFSTSEYPKLFVQKGICLLSQWPFLSAFKKFLTNLYQVSMSPSFVPLERYICNFIDDVPAPTSGKVDITYFLDDEPIQFQCPPLNEPNAWSGFPLFPLFECLSAVNIVTLFGLMFVERPIVFISSQYSLLTLCCEAMTSLLYPFRWAHSYVPILPSKLIGILSAPVPCIFGVHSDVYQQNAYLVSPEIVKVFLDDNKVDCGELGPPPKFPEGRYRKLINAIIQNVSWLTKTGDLAYTNQLWKVERLSLFDDALTDVTNNPMDTFWRSASGRPFAGKSSPSERMLPNGNLAGNALNAAAKISNPRASIRESKVNDQAIREGFLKFFVAMLKDYKRFLIYTNSVDISPGMHAVQERFRFDDFIREQPSEWRPLLDTLKDLQAFSNFLDDRIALNKLDRDVIFFDESIEAKLNRYTFRSKNFDTPFLTYEQDKHIKTYVPPTPFRADLADPEQIFPNGPPFPSLQPKWFIPPRNLAAKFPAPKDQVLSMLCRIRLKRKWTTAANHVEHLTGASCVYSSYLVITSLLLSHSIEHVLQMIQRQQTPALSALEVLREEMRTNSMVGGPHHGSSVGSAGETRYRRKSEDFLSMPSDTNGSKANSDGKGSEKSGKASPTVPSAMDLEKHRVKESAVIGLLVSLEILSSLTRGGHLPDEITYRLLAEACADLGRPWNLMDLIVFMDELDFIPDHQIRMALVRSINMEKRLRAWTLPTSALPSPTNAASNNDAPSANGDNSNADDESQSKPLTREVRSDTSISSRSDPGSQFSSKKAPSLSSPALGQMTPPALSLAHPDSTSRPPAIRRNSGTGVVSSKPTVVTSATPSAPTTPGRATKVASSPTPVPVTSQSRKVVDRPFPLTPAEVWTFQNWNTLQRPDTTVVLRSTVFGSTGSTGVVARSEDMLSKLFGMGHSSGHYPPATTSTGSASAGGKGGAATPTRAAASTGGSHSAHGMTSPAPAPSARPNPLPTGTIATSVNLSSVSSPSASAAASSSAAAPGATRPPLTGHVFEGYIPHLRWEVTDAEPLLSPRNVYATSSKLHRQVRWGETLLCQQYPGLHIDFTSEHGTKCPNMSCPCPRPLTIAEIYQGWSVAVQESVTLGTAASSASSSTSGATAASAAFGSSMGNSRDYANRYTCRCVYCRTDFIPRFAVRSTAQDWEGSDGAGSTLWCEFLSPWTLHKEVLNIIFEHGVTELLSQQFRSSSHQRAVVFWNLVVAFRLRGLPIAVLLTDTSVRETFPPK